MPIAYRCFWAAWILSTLSYHMYCTTWLKYIHLRCAGSAETANGKHGFDNAAHDDDEDDGTVDGRGWRSDDDVPAERQRTDRRHPEIVVRRFRPVVEVVRPRADRQLRRRQHPVRRLRARLQHRRQHGETVPRAGEEGHAGLERAFRRLHWEGCLTAHDILFHTPPSVNRQVPSVNALECAKAIIMPHRIIWNWYTSRWWVDCYIWYIEEGTGRGRSPPSLLRAVLNVTIHPSTASVPITVLQYNALRL